MDHATPVVEVVKAGWPIAATVLSGVFAFGSLSSDIHELKTQQAVAFVDHDKVTTLVQGQLDMKSSLDQIQQQLNRIEKQRK
jgi:hypothetical protein